MAQWNEAIKSEIYSILQNHTWELVDLLSGCKPLGYKWIFKKKMKANGTIDKYKERLAIKGFRQQEGLYYFDTYSTRITPVKMILAIITLRNKEVHQMDVKMTFLNVDLELVLYINQPEGFMAPGIESKVCKLVKSLYGLKKAPKQGHKISPYHLDFMNLTSLERGCNIGNVPALRQLALKDEYGFVIHIGSRLH
uniref:Calcineurin B-like protein 4 n=1 Tax=Tanacetum cinerariifolium TaxID=118510 RepID=A0A699JNB7_TANCI|nr:calcineurin B-like protein 4 [Tanacetum cinerariifolium]